MPTPTSNGIVSPVALSGANAIDSLLCGDKWGGARGTGIALTYSFSQPTSVYRLNYGIGEPKSGLSAFTDIQKNATRNALQAWSDVANVQFAEVVDSADSVGDLRFARSFVRTAQAYCPVAFPEAGDAWFSNFDSAFDTDQKGTYGYETFLHEIGHTLGLKHPHEAGKGGVANAEIDVIAYTLMSYRSYVGASPSLDPTESFYPTTPMLDDIAAVQYLYGANWNTRSGDSVYTWSPGQQILETIWDGGGTDTIDWSNQSSAAKINLNQGQWSELGPSYWNGVANESRTLAIAGEVTIENATGGSGNDNIIGNDGNNILNGGAGSDVMQGQEGDDRYVVDQPGDKVIEDPRAGNDTVEAAISYTLGSHLESLTLSGTAQINGKGNKFNNTITGNAMSNRLSGAAGKDKLLGNAGDDSLSGAQDDDTLVGGVGNDKLTGGSGADRFVFHAKTEGIDVLADFKVADDTLFVSRGGFGGGLVAEAPLRTTQFKLGAASGDASDRFIYNKSTGALFFDSDGLGGTEQVQFATLSTGLKLTSNDIFVIA